MSSYLANLARRGAGLTLELAPRGREAPRLPGPPRESAGGGDPALLPPGDTATAVAPEPARTLSAPMLLPAAPAPRPLPSPPVSPPARATEATGERAASAAGLEARGGEAMEAPPAPLKPRRAERPPAGELGGLAPLAAETARGEGALAPLASFQGSLEVAGSAPGRPSPPPPLPAPTHSLPGRGETLGAPHDAVAASPHPIDRVPGKATAVVEPRPRKADLPLPRPAPAAATPPTAETEEPRIEVRIGRIELRTAPPPTPAPARPEAARRGFEEYAAARRYLDRRWY
ncbi:MAG TPA: hypothetical protein VHQ90_09485 [Thermoanaerobaculia bacterium]|nr:hypothetical protein [Thermoanaerobaculia bacterium]